jgi:hypothetical protein
VKVKRPRCNTAAVHPAAAWLPFFLLPRRGPTWSGGDAPHLSRLPMVALANRCSCQHRNDLSTLNCYINLDKTYQPFVQL